MDSDQLSQLAETSLEDLKARDIQKLDVRGLTSFTDFLLVASGTSDRHVKSLSEKLVVTMKESGERPLGIEGLDSGEWVLIDLNEVIVHVMQPRIREFYKLEDLWMVGNKRAKEEAGS